jgi:hypothetical protein
VQWLDRYLATIAAQAETAAAGDVSVADAMEVMEVSVGCGVIAQAFILHYSFIHSSIHSVRICLTPMHSPFNPPIHPFISRLTTT